MGVLSLHLMHPEMKCRMKSLECRTEKLEFDSKQATVQWLQDKDRQGITLLNTQFSAPSAHCVSMGESSSVFKSWSPE